jgi:hypothetical protein
MPHDQILEETVRDARRLGLNLDGQVRAYRVINHPQDFYSLSVGRKRCVHRSKRRCVA